MARAVVECLKVINVNHDQGTLRLVPSEPQELTRQRLVKIPPIGQTRQCVLVTQLLQALVGFTQPRRLGLQGLAQLPQLAGALFNAIFQTAVDLQQFRQFKLWVGDGMVWGRLQGRRMGLRADIDQAGLREGQIAIHHLTMKLRGMGHEPGQRRTQMRHRHQTFIARIARQAGQHIGHRDPETTRHFLRNLVGQWRLHRTRDHRKHRHPLRSIQFLTQRQHHGPQSHLLRAVAAHEGHPLQRNQRHEHATAPRQHAGQRPLGQQHRRAQVGVVGLVPVVDGAVDHRVHLQSRGTVEHPVDRTEPPLTLCHQIRHARLSAQLSLHKVR